MAGVGELQSQCDSRRTRPNDRHLRLERCSRDKRCRVDLHGGRSETRSVRVDGSRTLAKRRQVDKRSVCVTAAERANVGDSRDAGGGGSQRHAESIDA
jgi:hypothetical protein